MNAREEREIEIGRFRLTLKCEFPSVVAEMADDVTRWGKVTPSTTRLVCRCDDYQMRNALQRRFYSRRGDGIDDTTVVFHF